MPRGQRSMRLFYLNWAKWFAWYNLLRLKRRGFGRGAGHYFIILQETVFFVMMWVTRCNEQVQRPIRVRFFVVLANFILDVNFILLVVYNITAVNLNQPCCLFRHPHVVNIAIVLNNTQGHTKALQKGNTMKYFKRNNLGVYLDVFKWYTQVIIVAKENCLDTSPNWLKGSPCNAHQNTVASARSYIHDGNGELS